MIVKQPGHLENCKLLTAVTWTGDLLDIHKERSGSGHKGLELVLAGLGGRCRVEEINCENL